VSGRTNDDNEDDDDKNYNKNNKNNSREINNRNNNHNNNKKNNHNRDNDDTNGGNKMSKDIAIASLNAILRSLTSNHQSLFKRFWEEFLKYENQENNNNNHHHNNRRINFRESNRNIGSIGDESSYNCNDDYDNVGGSSRSHNTRSSSSSSRGNNNDFIDINNKYGIKFDTLLSSLKEQLIVKNEKELKVLLKEFIDHHLIVITTYYNLPFICFKIPKDVMLKYYKK